MTAEASKKIDSTVVGDGGDQASSPRALKQAPQSKPWFKRLAILFIGVAIVAFGWWLISHYSGGAVFKIGSKRYNQAEVKQLAAYQVDKQHIPYKIAAKKVYDALRYQTAAQSVHITVTQAEEKKVIINVDSATRHKYKKWFDILAYNGAVEAKLPAATSDGRQGYAYEFWFGDAVQPSFGEASSKYGNQKAYQTDQQYAQQRVNYYHNQLQNKSMSPDAVLTAVKKDPKLAPYGQVISNRSIHFGLKPYENWQVGLANITITNYVKTASADSLSSIKTGQTATTLGPSPTKYVDAYYYLVLVQKTNIANITQQFHEAQAHLKAKYYGV